MGLIRSILVVEQGVGISNPRLCFLLFALFLSTLGFSQSAHATDNIVVCGNSNWGGLNQPRMQETRAKLDNPANFGPAGTFGDYSWTFTVIGTPTTANLNANNCDVWFSGYDPGAAYTDLPNFISNGGFVIGGCDNPSFDAVCEGLGFGVTSIANQSGGYVITNPPNYLTCDGLVNNAGMDLTTAGGASGYFSAGVIMGVFDAGGETLVITDSLTSPGFILTGDIDMYTTNNPDITIGGNVTSDQDKFVINSFKTAADTVSGVVALNGLPDCADISDIPVADLSITKDDGLATASVGASLNYTIEVINAGPEDTGTGVTLVDVLPTNVTVNSGSAGGVTLTGADAADWSCSADGASPQQIDCSYAGGGAGISASDSSEIIITTDPLPVAVENTTVSNDVEVFKGDGFGETDFTNNTASDDTFVDLGCVFGAGAADPAITSYISDEAYLNNATTRAAADTLDDAWRVAVGQPADSLPEPWLGFGGNADYALFEPDLFTTEGVSVDVSLIDLEPAGDCNGILAIGRVLQRNSNVLDNTAPRPESLYTVGTQPLYWRDFGGRNTSRNGVLFEFAQPVKHFGLWLGDFETRTDGNGEEGYMRLLDSAGNRIGADIAIAPSNVISSTGTVPVNQAGCGGSSIGCGNRATRWVGFVDSVAIARVQSVVFILGDHDATGNAFTERSSWIGSDPARDYSDAPASYGSPSHFLLNTPTLILGSNGGDPETAPVPTANADGDDVNDASDDEDAFTTALPIVPVGASSFTLSVPVTNSSGAPATLVGWIDFDRDNVFQADEAATIAIPDGTTSATPVSLAWPAIPAGTTVGQSYLRLRLSSDAGLDASAIQGNLIDGEVEDHPITIDVGQVDLTIVKSVDTPEAEVGSTVTFTLRVNNLGPADATNIVVTDIVPAGFTFVSNSMTGGNSRNQSSPAGTGLVWTINSLVDGGTEVVLTFQAVVNSP